MDQRGGFVFVTMMMSLLVTLTIVTMVGDCKSVGGSIEDMEEEGDEELIDHYDYEIVDDGTCEDDLSADDCSDVWSGGRCGDRQDLRAMLCMKTCGYCNSSEGDERSLDTRLGVEGAEEELLSSTVSDSREKVSWDVDADDDSRKECEDTLATCSVYYSPEFCCQMKQAMNYSCEKTCKFCSQSPATIAPNVPAQVPTATTNQDPCRDNNGQPPSVTVDSPAGESGGGVPGLTTTPTTTTTNPLATVLPTTPQGNPLTPPDNIPGITTSTTTTTTTANPFAPVLPTTQKGNPLTPPSL